MLISAFLFKSNNNCWFLISNMNSAQLQHQTITSLKSQPFGMDWFSFAFLFAHKCICQTPHALTAHTNDNFANALPLQLQLFAHPLNDLYCVFSLNLSALQTSHLIEIFFLEKCTCNYHANGCVRNTKSNDFIQFLRTSIIIGSKQNHPENSYWRHEHVQGGVLPLSLYPSKNSIVFCVSSRSLLLCSFQKTLSRCLSCCAFFLYKFSIRLQIEYLH